MSAKRQTARDRIEAERISIQNELRTAWDAAQRTKAMLEGKLEGVEIALSALGAPLKRQSANGAAKPRKVRPADPQLPIGA